MDILIKHQTKDGEIHFSTVESWKPTEDEATVSYTHLTLPTTERV